jgi:DNA repair and recombination protein RAD52
MPNATGVITKNPFEESPSRLNQYTSDEIATLQARLEKKLGPEYISSRPGAAGQKVHYLSADKCINLANEVFGFNGWSSSIQNIQIDFVRCYWGIKPRSCCTIPRLLIIVAAL